MLRVETFCVCILLHFSIDFNSMYHFSTTQTALVAPLTSSPLYVAALVKVESIFTCRFHLFFLLFKPSIFPFSTNSTIFVVLTADGSPFRTFLLHSIVNYILVYMYSMSDMSFSTLQVPDAHRNSLGRIFQIWSPPLPIGARKFIHHLRVRQHFL